MLSSPLLKRYIIIALGVASVLAISGNAVDLFWHRPSGDYETERGSLRLEDGHYAEALAHFERALIEQPGHRGAWMGKALVFAMTDQTEHAITEFSNLITFLEKTLEEDDITGQATLAAAYANRGIVKDRIQQHESALDDYIYALHLDKETLSGPGLLKRIVELRPNVSTVAKRARYLEQQMTLPEDQRLLWLSEKRSSLASFQTLENAIISSEMIRLVEERS